MNGARFTRCVAQAVTLPVSCAAALLLLILFAPTAWSDQAPDLPGSHTGGGTQAEGARKSPSRALKTEVVKETDVPFYSTFKTSIEAVRAASLRAAVSGRIAEIAVKPGDEVKKGQLLVRIEAPEIEAELEESRSGVERARTHARKAQALLALERIKREAAQAKRDPDQGLAVREASARIEVAETEVAEADAAVQVARDAVGKVMARLALARMVFPFDGTVTSVECRESDLVQAGGGKDDPVLVTVMDMSRVRIAVDLNEQDAIYLKKMPAAKHRITPTGMPPIEASFTRFAPVIDPASSTVRAEFELGNSQRTLTPGQSTEVVVRVEDRHHVITIPISAVVMPDIGDHYCYRLIDGRPQRVFFLYSSFERGSRVEVTGLKPGDLVVLDATQVDLPESTSAPVVSP